uniref:Uncharacterized protein MANES_05G158200 n=1 Tax=Rhizophora mucronata TaxID=61149 RepID=A0A2P2J6B6_RHIMU
MYLKRLIDRQTVSNLSRFSGGLLPPYLYFIHRYFSIFTINAPIPPSIYPLVGNHGACLPNVKCSRPIFSYSRFVHSAQQTGLNVSNFNLNHVVDDSDEDGTMNEFLSRFVWRMRGKLSEAYPDSDKQTIDGMLLIIVEKVVSEMEKGSLGQMLSAGLVIPSQDFSEDLWRTVWEVGNSVVEDMEKERKKEKMKGALHSEEVKEMCRFAADIGIRGDLLRELKFKWAREKVDENEFYESLEWLRKEKNALEKEIAEVKSTGTIAEEAVMDEEKTKVVSLPKRHGKIKHKIYGLDLSDPKWAEVADKIHETGEIIWPQEPKTISGKCKLLTENILSLKEEDDPSPLLAKWVELLQPSRIDWIALLDKLKGQNTNMYLKV